MDGTADYTSITSDAGAHTFNLTLTTINGTAATRDFTVEDKSTATTPFYYVWFNVIATREGLVGQTTARGHVLVSNDHFVALPATGLCIVGVRLRNANNAEDTTVLDIGPWCPNTPVPGGFNQCNCSSDGYWNTFGVPFAATASCATTHAGIDLVDATFANLF